MTDYGYPTTRKFPRTLESAFGAHTTRQIDEEDEEPRWRFVLFEIAYYLAAAALVAGMFTAPAWWPLVSGR